MESQSCPRDAGIREIEAARAQERCYYNYNYSIGQLRPWLAGLQSPIQKGSGTQPEVYGLE